MGAPIVIVHGWSDSSKSFRKLSEFLRHNLGADVAVIDLADWLSLNDEVTYNDLRSAMDLAWRAQPNLASATEVNVVTHSTGALVVRDWMTWRFPAGPAACPIKRLVMLAPANFGSPLAHMGTSFLARLFKGAKTGGQTGANILSGLELASDYTWGLATRDVLTAKPWYGSSGILATVLVGDTGYGGIQGIVNEVGSDGTVRVSTANLNVRKATLSFTPDGDVAHYGIEPARPEQQVGFGVLGGLNHGSITDPDSSTPFSIVSATSGAGGKLVGANAGNWVMRALTVKPAEFAKLCDDLATATRQAYGASTSDTYFHGYQNTVVRAFDDCGNPVEEYLVDFHERSRVFSVLGLGFLFNHQFIADVHNFKANSAYRSFYLDVTAIRDACGKAQLLLKVDPQPKISRDQPVGYPEVKDVPLNDQRQAELFEPNRTLLLDVTFPRRMTREKVFDIQPMG